MTEVSVEQEASTKDDVTVAPARAIVTGGARGIGAAVAAALSGAHHVAVLDVNLDAAHEQAERIERAGGQALAIGADVTDATSVEAAVRQVTAAWGGIDVLVNNAGWDRMLPFLETDEAFWRRVIEINYVGVLRLCHAVAPLMVAQRSGRIINVASDAARVGSSLEAVYSGAKGAVVSFSKALARELAPTGVTVNVVCPGPTDTVLLREVAGGDGGGDRGQRVIDAVARSVPLGRIGNPEDVAAAVAFFAAPEAGFITGQVLSVSGGLTMAG